MKALLSIVLAMAAGAGLPLPVRAADKPVVAMIGTGTLASTFGPAVARAGYPLVYGSREPARESVEALVAKSGKGASATTPIGR